MMVLEKAPNLSALAAQHGIDIVRHQGGEKGRWYPARRTISLRAGLPARAERCTLAHELGHAVLEHEAGAHLPQWLVEKQERAADRWAAETLISEDAYRSAEASLGPHPGAIAVELGVTVHLLEIWRAPRCANAGRSSEAAHSASLFP